MGSDEDMMVGPAARWAAGEREPEQSPRRADDRRYEPRPDWQRMVRSDWHDLRVVRTRLAAGADPDGDPQDRADGGPPPLHRAAEEGAAEVVAELAGRVSDLEAVDGEGHTALWAAVCADSPDAAAAMLAVGADPWRPVVGERSAGWLGLRNKCADVFAGLPGAVLPTADETARQQEADWLIGLFTGEYPEGLAAAFVAGLTEDEALRRVGLDPAACSPLTEADRAAWDALEHEAGDVTGVSAVPGGCVLMHAYNYWLRTEEALIPLSAGTTAYGLYFNPKGGVFGTLARDGAVVLHEEIGLDPDEDSPADHWLFRFYDRGPEHLHDASCLAYACWTAGLSPTSAEQVLGPPRRWATPPGTR
ncbi:DUF6461 domain-containing protein [Streptomyces sp. 549]|uniref:ankyrin repeat domain-containing protein n=1 Tax=Streptomyces sp. 549 TaxID=3049076 RepID=UPI0024C45DD3|nr:ankyrin repeat domain-containing protein [Streptomyces sp. 549]MDK1472491.1 DUF6461 domain-containing protein [Streptomyces sp. 549]